MILLNLEMMIGRDGAAEDRAGFDEILSTFVCNTVYIHCGIARVRLYSTKI